MRLPDSVYTGALGGEADTPTVRLALALALTGRVDAPKRELMALAGIADSRTYAKARAGLEALGLVDFKHAMLRGALARGDERCPTCGHSHAQDGAETRHERENVSTQRGEGGEAVAGRSATHRGIAAPTDGATWRDVLSELDSLDASGDLRQPNTPASLRRRKQVEALCKAWFEVFPNAEDGPTPNDAKSMLSVEDNYAVDVYDAWVAASKKRFTTGPLPYVRGMYRNRAAEKQRTADEARAMRANPQAAPQPQGQDGGDGREHLGEYGDKRPWDAKARAEADWARRMEQRLIEQGLIAGD